MRVQIRLSFRKAKKKKKSDLSCTAYSGVWTQQSPRTAFGKKKRKKKSDMCAEGCSQSALKKTTPALGTMWQEKKKKTFFVDRSSSATLAVTRTPLSFSAEF